MSIFSVKPIPIDFSKEDTAHMRALIIYATLLKDSRIAILSEYRFGEYEIKIINPVSFKIELSFGRCEVNIYRIEELTNGYIITSPGLFIYDFSNSNLVKKYDITKKSILVVDNSILPGHQMAVLYIDSKIEIYQSDFPYLLKYTLFNAKKYLQGNWVKYLPSVNLLMVSIFIEFNKERYSSLYFFNLETRQCATSIQYNHCNLIYSNIIELKNYKLLVEDEDSFYVLNLKNFCIEDRFDYKLNDYESCLNVNVPFLLRADGISQINLELINDKSKIQSFITISLDDEQVSILKFKDLICSKKCDNHAFLYDSSKLFQLTNNFH